MVVAYCDNDVSLWNTKIQGMAVLSPEMAACRYPRAVFVVTGRKSAEAMKQQLCSLGIEDRRICIFVGAVDMMLLRMK